MTQQRIGKDEWVASYQDRLTGQTGWRGVLQRIVDRLPAWGWLVLLVVLGLAVPAITSDEYVIRVAGTVALMATLGIGLNIVVGYAGLLDLGFVAFYGIGGYAYAYMSSGFTGLHIPTWISLPLIVVITALFGLLLGLPSLRLVGDYLAIVTLGFGQIFVQLTTSMTRVSLPGRSDPVNLTGGPNGIVGLDSFNAFGFKASSPTEVYLILLTVMVLVLLVVYHLNQSRLGRAWRALREDELAAELMGMPTRRLKLQAFAIGAAIAGLSGALFAVWQGSVFPANFDVTLLITLYAVVVLGGMGSLPGIVLGALIMIGVPELLRNPALAGVLFYIGVLVVLFSLIRPRLHAAAAVAGVAIFGSVLKLALGASSVALPITGALLVDSIRGWLVTPKDFTTAGNLGFAALVGLILLVSRIPRHAVRVAVLIPTLYLLIFVWETRLSLEPSVSRLLFVGVLLVVLMIYRPNGLLGQKRVEVV